MPSASVSSATIVKPGVLTKVRPANRRSCQIVNIILTAGDVDAAVGRDRANRWATASKGDANLLRPLLIRRRQFGNIAAHPAIGCACLQVRRIIGGERQMYTSIDRFNIESLPVPPVPSYSDMQPAVL